MTWLDVGVKFGTPSLTQFVRMRLVKELLDLTCLTDQYLHCIFPSPGISGVCRIRSPAGTDSFLSPPSVLRGRVREGVLIGILQRTFPTPLAPPEFQTARHFRDAYPLQQLHDTL
jgi:hypothetical protein